MIADMLLAVAEIAVAPGAVAELQLRVGGVCFAANGAAVHIQIPGLGGWLLYPVSRCKGNGGSGFSGK